MVTESRSGDTTTRRPSTAEKSTTLSTRPVAKNVVRSPLMIAGTLGVSCSRSTSTWNVPVAARNCATSRIAVSSGAGLWSTVRCSNGLPQPGTAATCAPNGTRATTAMPAREQLASSGVGPDAGTECGSRVRNGGS